MARGTELTNAYYTRYHIWQQLIAKAGELPAEDIKTLAEYGLEFVWRDGTDVIEEVEETNTPEAVTISSGGAYL